MLQDVTGRFLAPDGSPLSGSVVFTPTFLFARDTQAVTLPAPVTARLDAEGRVTASLLVPTPDTEPDAWVWEACPQLRGKHGVVRLRDFAFELTADAPVNLAEVTPVPDPVTGEYVTQGKPGADGVGLESITTEGGQLVFTLTDGSESRIPVPQGVPGDDGKPGVGLATITLEDGELVFTLTNGAEQRLPAPVGEKGDDGKPGQPGKDGTSPPAPTLRVGEVTTLPATATATAEITGEAPDYTLTLAVPQGAPGAKGDKGDSIIGPAGPKGEPGNPSALVLVGAGRPDTPSTLSPENQTAVANALVGATFTSTDGAGTGAWAWVKTPGGWKVTYGDTGWRDISSAVSEGSVKLKIRRILQTVYIHATTTAISPKVATTGAFTKGFTRTGAPHAQSGFIGYFSAVNNENMVPVYWAGVWGQDLSTNKQVWVNSNFQSQIFTDDPWPATLPGTPA